MTLKTEIEELCRVLGVKRNIPYEYDGEDYINPERVVELFLQKVLARQTVQALMSTGEIDGTENLFRRLL